MTVRVRWPIPAVLVVMSALLGGGAAIADDDIPKFCRNGEGHPEFGRRWCIEKGFGLGGDPHFRRGFYGGEPRFDDDHWKEAEKREREREREYWKKRQENERERLKHRQEIEREARKHYEELERERRKHREELDRESRKRIDHPSGSKRVARDWWRPTHASIERYDAPDVAVPDLRSEVVRPRDPVLARERGIIADEQERDEKTYERY